MAKYGFTLLTALLVPLLSIAGPEPKAPPRPAVPALTTAPEGRTSSVATGVRRLSPDSGIGFRVVCDGKQDVCGVFDAADGTPIFISDGKQALVYDLASFRIARLESTRAYAKVDWEAGHERPLVFGAGLVAAVDPAHLAKVGPAFRVDHFVRASADTLRVVDHSDDRVVFAAERPGVAVEAISKSPTDPTWFRFSSAEHDNEYYSLELTARRIGQRIPDAENVVFPDLDKLKREINLVDISAQDAVMLLADQKRWNTKLALALGGEFLEAAKKNVPDVDWDQMKRRDVVLGKLYRDALAKQGIRFTVGE